MLSSLVKSIADAILSRRYSAADIPATTMEASPIASNLEGVDNVAHAVLSSEFASSGEQSNCLSTSLRNALLPECTISTIPLFPDEQFYLLKLKAWGLRSVEESQTEGERSAIASAIQTIQAWVHNQDVEQALVLDNLDLKSLPELPQGLISLSICNNKLSVLPPLPTTLKNLAAKNNQLIVLPPLPQDLETLDVCDNRLSCVPEILPPNLRELYANKNQIAHLPTTLPFTLRGLALADNPITALPEMITALPEGCIINLDHIPLTNAVYERLRGVVNTPGYSGPRFYISREGYSNKRTPALPIVVSHWYMNEHQANVKDIWQPFRIEDGAVDFSRFLERLRDSIHFQRSEFKKGVRAWLAKLVDDSELRKLTFTLAKEGSGSCADRAILTFHSMKNAEINLQIERGNYDQRLDELLLLARGMFRLEELESIASAKAADLRFVDEIEVYLAYQVKLREELALSHIVPEMQFFDVSSVTQNDLDYALICVQEKEKTQFFNYLANHWGPWKAVLKRLCPLDYLALQDKISTAADKTFMAKQNAFLQAAGLKDNEYNRAKVTSAVLEDIAQEINTAFTCEFLRQRGCF